MRLQRDERDSDSGRKAPALPHLQPSVVERACPDNCGCCVTVSADFVLAMVAMSEPRRRKGGAK